MRNRVVHISIICTHQYAWPLASTQRIPPLKARMHNNGARCNTLRLKPGSTEHKLTLQYWSHLVTSVDYRARNAGTVINCASLFLALSKFLSGKGFFKYCSDGHLNLKKSYSASFSSIQLKYVHGA